MSSNDAISGLDKIFRTIREKDQINILVKWLLVLLQGRNFEAMYECLEQQSAEEKEDVVYSFLREITTGDFRRSEVITYELNLFDFWYFLRKEHPEDYAYYLRICCLRSFYDDDYEDFSELFGWKGFNKELPKFFLEPWLKELLLFQVHQGSKDVLSDEMFNDEFLSRFAYRFTGEFRDVKNRLGSLDESKVIDKESLNLFLYFARVLDFGLSLHLAEDCSIWTKEGSEKACSMKPEKYKPKYEHALEKLREVTLYLYEMNAEQFLSEVKNVHTGLHDEIAHFIRTEAPF